jgi:hypothetical protein
MPGEKNPQTYIPIHTSDRAAFKRCRRRWNWTSPMRENLIPKRKQHGVVFPLWFGTGIHAALEWYYLNIPYTDGDLRPSEFFEDWYNNEVDVLNQEAPDWYIEHLDELEEHFQLGIGMLDNYVEYAKQHDNFVVMRAEEDFAVDLGFSEYDRRAGLIKPVKYAGRQDLIIKDLETGRYGIMDHKTASQMGEDYFDKLDMDEQCTSYLWAASRDHALLKLTDGVAPSFVYYNVLRKAVPKPPTETYNGSRLSISRSAESTTYDMWQAALIAKGLVGSAWHQKEDVQNYERYLKEVGWEQFFVRKLVLRNPHEIMSIGNQIQLEAHDMLDMPSIYPNPSESWYCLKCPFRGPCLATNDGSDVDYMIKENFEPNTDR